MPRKYQLTWQPGSAKRFGRWRKKYKGKAYYFAGGRGKSDRDAYENASREWGKLKLQIDAEAPKRHQLEYDAEIEKWESVLNWSRVHKEPDSAEVATKKIAVLQDALATAKPKPVPYENTFEAWFDLSVQDPKLFRGMEEIGNLVCSLGTIGNPGETSNDGSVIVKDDVAQVASDSSEINQDTKTFIYPDPKDSFLGLSGLELDKRIWEDRIAVMKKVAVNPEESLSAYAAEFLTHKRAAADAKTISAGRFGNISKHINDFVNWRGSSSPVDEINGRTLSDYFADLQQQVIASKWTPSTAKDRLASVKMFIRWLWQLEAIPSLPRNIDSRSLSFDTPNPDIVVFENKEIEKVIKAAADRTKLFVLLMLNCGMTQKDIADLVHPEVNWVSGRITRKRSKTRKSRGTPLVNYSLWPETLQLLKAERAPETEERVLVNQSGAPLWRESIHEDGKTNKKDNIRGAYRRVQSKSGVRKPLKSLKKTSATHIRSNPKYASLEGLFLGHAPKSMSDRHYTLPPQQLLDEAIGWLRTKYGIQKSFGDLAKTS